MRRWVSAMALAVACANDDGGDDGAGTSSSGGGSSSSGAVEATTAPLESSTTMPAESSSEGAATSSDSGVAESSEGTTGNATVCDPPLTQSACGNPNSIVRGTATVGDGAPTTGTLLLALTHQYLGDGASGGIYHISATIPAVDFAAGPVPFELDMCAGGEMWSEENCEFQISVALDANDNGVIDAGDPTGKQFVFVSCTGDNPCLELALDCTDGTSCVAFPDPGYCACPGNGQVCNSPIVAC